MKNPVLIATCVAGLLLFQACSDDSNRTDTPGEPRLTGLAGEVAFAELGKLPRDATINIELIDVSDGVADGMVIASAQTAARSASPYSFKLLYDPGLIQEGRQYRLYATVQLEGKVIDDSAGSIDPFVAETVALSFKPQSRTEVPSSRLITLSLQDIDWQLSSLGEKSLASEMITGKPTILVDGKETSFSGYSGCNQYSGTYVLDGTSLKFENIASTRRACETGMELESEFLEMLGNVATWRMDGQNMVLGDKERNELARFEYVEG